MRVRWFGERGKEVAREGSVEALIRGSEFLLAKANETVPIEESTLKNSGATDVDDSALVATVYYNTPYAARQHEEIGWNHAHGRRAKWLQLTMQEQTNALKDILADALRRRFAR